MTRTAVSGILSSPKRPNRSITAAITRLPVTRIPIVAAVPMRGEATVIPSTTSIPMADAVHIQGG